MQSINNRTRRINLLGALVASSVMLSGCATEDYVNQQIAMVNGRIDHTNAYVAALQAHVNQAAQQSAAAMSAAQAAARQAQAATADAARANDRLDHMRPQVAHLMHHHKHKTWRNVSHRHKH